jgi:signal transduction histidine kinase/lipoprotein signal peptidase
MNVSPTSLTVEQPHPVDITGRLQGWWLLGARVAWVLVTLLSIGLFIASLPLAYAEIIAFSGSHTPASHAVRAGLEELGISAGLFAAYWLTIIALIVAVFVGVGALVFWRKPENRTAFFFSLALVTFGAIWPNTLDSLVIQYSALEPVTAALNYFGFLSFFLLAYVFPDGRFVPRWTRWIALWIVVSSIGPFFLAGTPFDSNTWPEWINLLEGFAVIGTLIFAQIYRYRRVSTPIQRQQTKWVMFSLLTALLCFITTGTLEDLPTFQQPGIPAALLALASSITYGFAFMLVPIAIGIAVLRYRLWDIDPIINRTLVYGALTASVIGIYVLVVGYLGALFRTSDNLLVSLIATGIMAVLFQPLREQLQRIVNRLMYGERDEPYAVVSRLGQRLEATLAPDAILPTIVETVKEALKLPYVAIALKSDQPSKNNDEEAHNDVTFDIVVATGTPVSGEALCLPLVYQNEMVGQFILEPRAQGETFSPADRRLLEDLARQAGVAAHAVRLTADLQRSRERLVTAREEERRRLRRDLHDGLGPTLAAQTLKVGSARYVLERDPTTAKKLLGELEHDIDGALQDIRRLVYNLRPPALDELGLVGAIRASAAHYQGEHRGSSLRLVVNAPEILPPLPAAIEVAAYRITQEALTNVVRHAQARSCTIRLTIDSSALHLEIHDDGVGLPVERHTGVGLQSMRERAEELGGTCMIKPGPTGGTHVIARLPLPHDVICKT